MRLEHRRLEVLQVLELDWVGGVVRERAVEVAVEDGQVERQAFEDLRHDEAAHAVGSVGDHPKRPQLGLVDERSDVRRVALQQVLLLHRAVPFDRRGDARLDAGLDLGEARVLSDGTGATETQLDAVVLRGIVRRGEHGPRRVEVAGGVIEQVGRRQAQVDDIGALGGGAFRKGGGQRHTRRAHVARHQHAIGAREAHEGCAEGARQFVVELVGDRAADVVRLEDGVEGRRHGRISLLAGRTPPGRRSDEYGPGRATCRRSRARRARSTRWCWRV